MFTNFQLVEYMEKVYAAGWRYWYGTVGYKCTNDLYKRKKKQYPSHYGSSRTSGYKADIAAGAMCADCVGVIKSFFWTGGILGGKSKYGSNNCPDRSANGMFGMCKVTGPIATIPDVPGLVVWRSGHIGVYVGGGMTIELRGFAYDCQKRKVTAGTWTNWGYLPENMLAYVEDEETLNPGQLGDIELSRGMEGEHVVELQNGEGAPDGGSEPVKMVKISGDCWVRNAPNTGGDKLGVAHKGDKLLYADETAANGWLKVKFKTAVGWVSGKYGRLEG